MSLNEKINVLIVDDRPENLLAIESVLDGADLNLVRANSGNEALTRLFEFEFALVLLDVQMPEMDGFETAEMMRSIEKTRQIPIIFVTAISKEKKYVFRGYHAGAVDYLFKPIDSEILKAKVSVFLELYRKRRELEHANRQLRASQRELKRSNKALQEFAYAASHDLDAPLRHIVSYVQMLIEENNDDLHGEARGYLERIHSSTKRMQTLIRDLLEYAQIAYAAKGFHELDLDELVRYTTEDFASIIHQTGAELLIDKLPKIEANQTQMRQLFQNLIDNALKYGPEDKPPIIRISAETDPEHNQCRIKVADNGIGFEPKFAADVFNPFIRLVKRTRCPGSGLGLAIAEKVVLRHGGSINAEATPNQGATFVVTLPLKQADDPNTE